MERRNPERKGYPMKNVGRVAALLTGGLAMVGALALSSGTASAAEVGEQAPIVGYTPVVMPADEGVTPAAAHWYVKGRLGSFNIRATHNATGTPLQTVKAGQGAWCWNQTSDCGAATKGGSYRCSSTTPKYSDWIPVATSSKAKGWVARHCVYAVHQ
jgi:hypothetical protein